MRSRSGERTVAVVAQRDVQPQPHERSYERRRAPVCTRAIQRSVHHGGALDERAEPT
jgi:hypothetical protein